MNQEVKEDQPPQQEPVKEQTAQERVQDEVNRQNLKTPKVEVPKQEVPSLLKVTDPTPAARAASEEVKQLFKNAKPVTDQEKLDNLKEMRGEIAPRTP